MRNALIALFAVVGFGSGLAFAQELKAPSCDAHFKGVMWNFGSEEHPDIRRCDGISYIPYGLPMATGATASAAPAPKSETQRRSCESICDAKHSVCDRECSLLQPNCKENCMRAKTSCMTQCE